MPEQRGQRLDAGRQAGVGGLHLPAEPRDKMHGRVQGVFVDQVAIVADEGQDAVQAPGFEHSTCLPGTNQFQDLWRRKVFMSRGQRQKKVNEWINKILFIGDLILFPTNK